MDNPLKRFVSVDERPDGMYVKVTREQKEGRSLRSVIQALDEAMVVNYDVAELTNAWTWARGVAERIGPLFEYYNPDLDNFVEVETTPLEGFATVNSMCTAQEGVVLDELTLTYCLKRKGIKFGLKPEVIRAIIQAPMLDTKVLVAEGLAPVDGENGRIRYEVDVTLDKKPKVLEDGSVDYRDIQAFTQVDKGQVLGRLVPPTKGTAGKSVGGKDLPAKPGQEYRLVEGRNVLVSKDRQTLVAAIAGIVFADHELIHVNEKLSISSDVDFKVGNVKFSGSVTISGDVHPGFTVECEDNITINGEMETGTVNSRNGTVTIRDGVLGNSVIFGKQGVEIGFCQNATITTEGTLTIRMFCLHSNCICDSFKSEEKCYAVVGGRIVAHHSVLVANLGNEKEVPTRIEIVEKKVVVSSPADKNKKATAKIDPMVLEVLVLGDVFPGVEIVIGGLSKIITERMVNKRFVLRRQRIEIENGPG